MVQTVQAKDINLRYLIDNFGLGLVLNDQFFWEWQDDLRESTDLEKQLLDKVKAGYFNLINYPPLLQDVVRMAIVDPILFIGYFYLSPFYVKSEEPIDIAVSDDDVIIKGRINTLVLKDQFWVMIIESEKASFSIEEGPDFSRHVEKFTKNLTFFPQSSKSLSYKEREIEARFSRYREK